MPIDPSIAMSYKPVQIQDPMEMYGKRQQIQTNALAMQKYQNESAEKNALAQLISQPGYDPYNEDAQAAAFKVAPNLAPGMFKALQETRTAGVDYDTKTQALGTARRNESNAKKLDAIKAIIQFKTPESALADVARRVGAGELTQEQADVVSANIPKTEADMPAWKEKTMFSLLDPEKQLEQTTRTDDLGGTVRTTVGSKYAGGAAPVVTSTAKTLTPGEISTAATARRGQNMTQETARLAREVTAGRLTPQTDAAGNVNFFNAKGGLVTTARGAGKPSATFEKTKILRQNTIKDLGATITQLEKATAPGGLIDKSTSSGAGAMYDKTAGFFGKATEGAVAIGALQPIYDMVLKMVPRFEGPQSNADTVSYNQAAGNLANPNTPKAVKKAAATTILNLMKTRKNQFISQEEAGGGGIVGEAPSSSDWGPAFVVPEE
jgi:hypothetical protein